MGSKRHLSLLPNTAAEQVEWPVPFADGVSLLASFEGRPVAVLASGDPFWFGAGSVIARQFSSDAWQAFPAPSTFAHAASRLGWALENTVCLGLHAAPLTRLRPYLVQSARCLVLLRDGEAVASLSSYLCGQGFGESEICVMEALGGPRENIRQFQAMTLADESFQHPVCVGIDLRGHGVSMPACSGLPDTLFESDGVMTKRPVRAMTLSALAPVPGETLWDIGGGSGSIAIEWLLAHPACAAVAIEARADRVGFMKANAVALGADRLVIVSGTAPDDLEGLPKPDAIFIGGGLSTDLIDALSGMSLAGTRVVANAVTLEGEGLLTRLHQEKGGSLLRIELAEAQALGSKTAWKPTYPIVQWSGVL